MAAPTPSPSPAIDLFRGWPNPSLHPTAALEAAAAAVLRDPARSAPAFGYGPDEGDPDLRAAVARWLSGFYASAAAPAVTPDRLCITGGASQALACLLQVFADPARTRAVWMVEPTYYLACRIFDDAGFAGRMRAVPEDAEGIDVEFLEAELNKCDAAAVEGASGTVESQAKSPFPWRKIYKHIIYAVPTFSNPSGGIMTTRRREQLVRLARAHDALLVADDVYDFLQWPGGHDDDPATQNPDRAVTPRLVDIDRVLDGGPRDDFGNAISNGSFSKLIGPGFRVGWVEAAPRLAYGLSQTGSTISGGAPSQLTSTFVRELLTSHFVPDFVHHTLRPVYRRRYHLLASAIATHLAPLGVHHVGAPDDNNDNDEAAVRGGYFIWIQLPATVSVTALAARARREEALEVGEGRLFRVAGDRSNRERRHDVDRYVRLCFAYEEEPHLSAGVQRLARALRRELRVE
ncbi:Valine--pyruvate aminotransferase [Ophidiomyces ophidiicola]|uniref:Valine--pyruvate aminotransferase n=1 Tax=Ophidiomyces ophidiicola TaxID=1387563 RepID=A0ACB8UMQ2_9EURO|nr:Valine--pyruvate aminotransferase [Ophidiomyces ophidiicola]KAI1932771.1 Valine--pyruvate aminotransferase [Ophidiomyces ophidiicola]KAI1963816.1 Valine--pyruvate aminotransferase [Ophidiomyces ophidiicola]KAI1998945.1 Valine--pyruvate aminotransferase [Ophidiomyces ophidiicola]KAI2008246.1 Valine--pyruvate aminotransferase [Ophidiomyces ophidiicola]